MISSSLLLISEQVSALYRVKISTDQCWKCSLEATHTLLSKFRSDVRSSLSSPSLAAGRSHLVPLPAWRVFYLPHVVHCVCVSLSAPCHLSSSLSPSVPFVMPSLNPGLYLESYLWHMLRYAPYSVRGRCKVTSPLHYLMMILVSDQHCGFCVWIVSCQIWLLLESYTLHEQTAIQW